MRLVLPLMIFLLAACTSLPRQVPDWIREDAHGSGSALAFNRDSTYLASAGKEGTVRLWTLPQGAPGPRWRAHDGPVTGLAFIEGGGRLLSAGWDATLALWSRPGVLGRRVSVPSPVTGMAVGLRADRLVTGHQNGTVGIWALDELRLIDRRRVHQGAVRAVAVAPGGQVFASSGTEGDVFLWREGGTPEPLPAPESDAWSLAFSPDGRYLMGGGWFKLFRWSIAERTLRELATEHRGIITSMDFRRDGTLATISRQTDSAVDILDPTDGAVVTHLQKHALCGTYVRFSPDSRYLATTSDDASVRFWELGAPAGSASRRR